MANNTAIPEIYAHTIDRFEQITHQKLRVSELLDLRTVEDLFSEISRHHDAFSVFRQRRESVFSGLQSALKPVEMLGNVAAGGASLAFPPSSLVFGAVSILINAQKGVSESYDAIESLFGELKAFTERLQNYGRIEISPQLREISSQIIAILVEVLALSQKEIKKGRSIKYLRNLVKGNDDEIQNAMKKLEKLVTNESRMVLSEMAPEIQRVGRTVDRVDSKIEQLSIGQNELHSSMASGFDGVIQAVRHEFETSRVSGSMDQIQANIDRAKTILQPSKSSLVNFDEYRKQHEPGTGDWVREEPLFTAWLERTSGPLLWISGIPGAGKTYLSFNIISFLSDYFAQRVGDASRTNVAFFYFKNDDPSMRSFLQALRNIAYQACQNDPVYAKHIVTQCSGVGDVDSIRSAWRSLFVEFYIHENNKLDSSLFFVLDGIDEAMEADREIFFELSQDLEESSRLRLLVLGRPHIGNEIAQYHSTVPTITVTETKNAIDIVQYIHSSIKRSPKMKRLFAREPQLQLDIVEKLTSRSQGMFMWANLMIKELFKKETPAAIRKSLDQAPKGLTQMIRHVLEGFSVSTSIDDEIPEILNELLSWVTVASIRTPLTLAELDGILAMKSEDDGGVIDLERLLRINFASFFTLTREDGLSTGDLQSSNESQDLQIPPDGVHNVDESEGATDVDNPVEFRSSPTTTTISFSHAAIGDFFRSTTEGKVSAGTDRPFIGVHFESAKQHCLISCLNLLTNDALREKYTESFPDIAMFAVKNWIGLLESVDYQKVGEDTRAVVRQHVVKLLGSLTVMEYWAGRIPANWLSEQALELLITWADGSPIGAPFPGLALNITTENSSRCHILYPIAHLYAQRWLHEGNWMPQYCAVFICAFRRLETREVAPDSLTADAITQAAEWAGLDRNALWYQRLAIALREHGHYDKAANMFTKALSMDPTYNLAELGLGWVYVKQVRPKDALVLFEKGANALRWKIKNDQTDAKINQENLHKILEAESWCHFQLGQGDEVRKCLLEASSLCVTCAWCIGNTVARFKEINANSQIIEFLKRLQGSDPGNTHNALTQIFWRCADGVGDSGETTFLETIIEAAEKIGESPFLIATWKKAILEAREVLRFNTALTMELILGVIYHACEDMKNAVRVWTRLLLSIPGTDSGSGLYSRPTLPARLRGVVHRNLAPYSLGRAADHGLDSHKAVPHISLIHRMIKISILHRGGTTVNVAADWASLSLGTYHLMTGEEAMAIKCFIPHVKLNLDLLSDDDPGNDQWAFQELLRVLVAARDDELCVSLAHADALIKEALFLRATEVKQQVVPPLEQSMTSNADTPLSADSSTGPKITVVAGGHEAYSAKTDEVGSTLRDLYGIVRCSHQTNCSSLHNSLENAYICRICLELYCTEHSKMRYDTSKRLCSNNHGFLHIPKREVSCEPGKFPWKGKQLGFEEWKSMIRERWKI